MASHEWAFEDIIHVEELDSQSNENTINSFPNDDPSRSHLAGSLPEPNETVATASPNPSTTIDQNTSPGSMHGYDLSHCISREYSALMLPPSSYGHYQPWSPLSMDNGVDGASPRTTPDSLVNGTTMRLDPIITHASAFRFPFEVHQPSSKADASVSYTPSESELPLLSSSDSSIPDVSLGTWWNGTTHLSYTSLEPWSHIPESFNPVMDSFESNFSLPADTPPSPWGCPSALPSLSSAEAVTRPNQRAEDTTNSDSCISPSQTTNSHSAPSPTSLPYAENAWWPLPDLLLSEQNQPSPWTQLPMPSPTPHTDLPRSQIQGPSLSPGSDEVDGYHVLFQHAQNKWSDVGARDQDARDAALLEMRNWGLSYKDIKRIGNFPDALPTLRGRHRILTTPSTERVRRPPWQPRDEQLLRDAVRAQLSKPRVRRTQRITWKEVADYVNRHGSSYKFSYVTCSQKWQQMMENSHGFGSRGVRSIRGRSAFHQ